MPRTSLEQLNAFVAVAQQGSFSRAARVVKKDRATLHHQVGNLEIDWGVTLFDRSGRSPVLTQEGESLLLRAKHILYQVNSLEKACDLIAGGNEQEITLYHDIAVDCQIIQHISARQQQKYPETELHWLHRNRAEAIKALVNKETDFALLLNTGNILPTEGLSFINLGYHRFSFYAHRCSSLARQAQVTLTDLETQRQYIAENFADILVSNKLYISTQIARVSNIDVLFALLKNGGYALLPCHLAESELYRDEYRKLDIDFMLLDGRVAYTLLSPSQVSISPVKLELRETICDVFRSID